MQMPKSHGLLRVPRKGNKCWSLGSLYPSLLAYIFVLLGIFSLVSSAASDLYKDVASNPISQKLSYNFLLKIYNIAQTLSLLHLVLGRVGPS